MKSIGKKILTGTIAATFLIGGAGLLHNTQANAATTATSAVQSSNASTNDHVKRGHGSNLIQEAATILGVDQTTITDQLKQGQTLVQVAQGKGMTEDVLLQKLTDAENQSIDAAVTAGTITQAQADKKKSGLAARLKKEVENTEQHNGHEKGGFTDKATLSQILGITQQELTTNLQAGQSLAEIAQAKGINEDQLISNIKDSMTNKLKQYVEKKDQPEAGDTPDTAVGATANAPTAGAAVDAPEAGDTSDAPATNSSNTASATN
jgi:hypothetical protein